MSTYVEFDFGSVVEEEVDDVSVVRVVLLVDDRQLFLSLEFVSGEVIFPFVVSTYLLVCFSYIYSPLVRWFVLCSLVRSFILSFVRSFDRIYLFVQFSGKPVFAVISFAEFRVKLIFQLFLPRCCLRIGLLHSLF